MVRQLLSVSGARVLGILISFATLMALTKLVPVSEFGQYSYWLSIVAILAIPATAAVPIYLMREFAGLQKRGEIARIPALSRQIAVFLAILALVSTFVAVALEFSRNDSLDTILLIAIIVLWGTIMFRTSVSYCHALGKVQLSSWLENVLRPVFFLALLGTLVLISGDRSSVNLLIIHGVSLGFVALVAFYFGMRTLTNEINLEKQKRPDLKVSGSVKLNLWSFWGPTAVTGTQVVTSQMDIVILGYLHEPAEVAVFRVALQISTFAMLGFGVANHVYFPSLARSHANSNLQEVSEISTRAARIGLLGLLIAALMIGIIALLPSSLLFGEDYDSSFGYVWIILIGYAVNIGCGPVFNFLMLSRNEREALAISAGGILLNLTISFLLVPKYGALGSAIALASTMALVNIAMVSVIALRWSFNPTAIKF